MMKKTLLTAMTAVLAAGMAFMVSCGTKSEKPEEFPVETPVEGPSEEAQETESQGSDIDAPETGEENTPSATKPAETKPAESKPAETKPSTTAPSKPAETKPSTTTPAKPAETAPKPAPKPAVNTKTETKTESIPFQTVRQNDATLEKGKEVVSQNGVAGTKSISYKVTYTDGKETAREKVSEKITKAAVNKIIKVGTKAVAVNPAPAPTPTPKPTPTPAPVVTTKTETKTESIAFKTVRQDDPTLEKGKEVVVQNGVNGTRTITYTVTYTDGKETGRTVASDKVTKEPVNQIIKVGTKVEAPKRLSDLGNSGMEFDTMQAALNWGSDQIVDENSKWFMYSYTVLTVFYSDDNNKYTVNFY